MVAKRKKKLILGAAAVALVSLILAVAWATPRSASPYYRLKVFAQVLSHLERLYVEPIDGSELINGAIRGMVRTLDPHSTFLPPEDFEMLSADTRGRFGGVGMEVGIQDDVLTIIAPIPNSPAEEAGVLPRDQIIAIEGKPTRNMSIDDAVRIMRGEPGTKVTATFRRPGKDEPFELTFEREVIRVESVKAELLGKGFPWIQVRSFQDGTTAEVIAAIEKLTQKSGGLEGLILDLRRNPGGLLQEAVLLSDKFIAAGSLVTTRGRGGRIIHEYRANERGTIKEIPIVVIIDGASASAAEIVAGALQDSGRALLVGIRSFGKGSVQSIIELSDGYGLKLTTARYFTPSGRSIQVEGVMPDVVIESRTAPEPDAETVAIKAAPGEGDLIGHLKSENDTGGEGEKKDKQIEDYQLRIAHQLLVGLAHSKRAAAQVMK